MRLAAAIIAFVAFTTYTLWVMAQDGILGFLELAGREPWGLQLLADLLVMLTLFAIWVHQDAKKRGVAAWPWVVATLTLGSMGALAYLVHREWKARRS